MRFSESVTAAERAARMAEGGFAFAFKEGALVKALRQGHWVLLDEINLAPSEVGFPGPCTLRKGLVQSTSSSLYGNGYHDIDFSLHRELCSQ